MEPIIILVSLRSSAQAVSDEDRDAKSSRKNAHGKKHMSMLEQKLYQVLRRTARYRDHRAFGPYSGGNSAIFSLNIRHNPYVIILTFVFTN
jgi:hypothetical protein